MVHLKPLRDQVVVITGASSGIGLVTARIAAKRGAQLVLVSRNQEALTQLAKEINCEGGHALAVPADIGVPESAHQIVRASLEHFGGFDTWINNAGVSIFGRLDQVTKEDMHRLFQTNFWGVVYGSLAAAKHLKQRGGAIINIGSVFSDRATPMQSIYAASKHAVKGFTDALRMELEAEGTPISVTLIKPGRIDTPYTEHARNYQEKQPSHHGMIYPPEAVAEAILHCAEHPRRDLYVGSQAKIVTLVGTLAPRLMDKLMEKTQLKVNHDDKPSHAPEDNALHHAGYGMHEHGEHKGWLRSRSLYTKASLHRGVTAAALVGFGAAILTAYRVRR